jgi:hypothetical protein
MPHPERSGGAMTSSTDGAGLIESLVTAAVRHAAVPA